MVLGLGSKTKGTTVKVEFQIHVQEIKPWKPASRGNIPLLVQWQRGENRSGKTKSVLAKQEDGGKLVFNDTFRLPAKLIRESEGKGRNVGTAKFQKKTIVFVLQEAKTDIKLARCVVDLAEYGNLDSKVPASIPLAVGNEFVTGGQTPVLFLAIGPFEKKEDRSFTSRVSFGSSTPRTSISRAPERTINSGKSKVEPALDEDLRKSLTAALLSDEEDDNVSIESFTDDEGSTEVPTPKSKITSASSTPSSEASKASPSASRFEIAEPSASKPETSTMPLIKPTSHSERLVNQTPSEDHAPPYSPSHNKPITAKKQDAGKAIMPLIKPTSHSERLVNQTPSEDHAPPYSPSHNKPITAKKQDAGKAIQTPSSIAEDRAESSRPLPTKHGFGKTQSSTTSAEEHSKNFPASLSPAASKTRLFSTDPVHKSMNGGANFVKEPVSHVSEEITTTLGSAPSGNQAIKGVKRSSSTDKREEDAQSPTEPSSSPSKASKISLTSSEAPQSVTKLTDTNGSSSWQSKTALGSVWTERPMSPKDDEAAEIARLRKIIAPLPPASAKAAAAASAYVSNSTAGSPRDPSLNYAHDTSDDSSLDFSNDGRLPLRTPFPDQSTDLGLSVSGLGPFVGARQSDENEGKSAVLSGEEPDERRTVLKSADLRKDVVGELGMKGEGLIKDKATEDENETEEEGTSVLISARANLAKVEKRALEELRTKIASVEVKFLAETLKVEKLQGELRDMGAIEVALYCVVAEHGNSSHKLHTPARRLARLYMHTCAHFSPERRAGTAKNCVSGLVTVAKSCGTDTSRLSFWWSNVVTLRAVITQAFDTRLSSVSVAKRLQEIQAASNNKTGPSGWARARARKSVNGSNFAQQAVNPVTARTAASDWGEASTYIAALEKIEDWIYSKIVETLWWQAMIPRMQKNVDASAPTSPRGVAILSPSSLLGPEFANKAKVDLSKLAGDVSGIYVNKAERRSLSLPELGDARQGNFSVEVWKKAIVEALRRLCPVRGAGHECGCLPMLVRMAIEGCVARLDVALFNAILREPDDDVPTDPLSDPVSDSSVLPIPPGGLTFGGGSQLKNVVVTWSTFIAGLVSFREPLFVSDEDNADNAENSEDSEKAPKFFNLIKATGDLLMLPKDILMDRAIRKEEARREAEKCAPLFIMLRGTGDVLQLPKDILMDKSLRKEICPMLSLQLIRRILVNFVPDEFAPDPISPSLLAALNAEATIEKQRLGESDDVSSSVHMAAAPPITYVVPSAHYIWSWIGEASPDPKAWGRSSNSLLRKGYTSDEDLDVMEKLQKSSASDSLEFLIGTSRKHSVSTPNETHSEDSAAEKTLSLKEISPPSRFGLLKEVWGT